MNKLFLRIALGAFWALDVSLCQADCRFVPQHLATEALKIIKTQTMVIEYCKKCDNVEHRPIGVRYTGLDCDTNNLCRILINGTEVDMAHLFAINADGREENIGYAAGCLDALQHNSRFLDMQ